MLIEVTTGAVGFCDLCSLGVRMLHATSTGEAFCATCADSAVLGGTAQWTDSLPATLDATIQVLQGSPLDTPIDAPHELTPEGVTVEQQPTWVIGPEGNRWPIVDEVELEEVECPECKDVRLKKGHALLSPQNRPWLHVQCASCHIYIWLELIPKGGTNA